MENQPQQHCFTAMSDLAVMLAQKIATHLKERLQQQDQVSLIVSGGNTPKILYEKLSTMDLDWSRVVITLTDERWVAVDDHNSNEWLIKNSLLINKAKAAQWISLKTDDTKPEQAIKTIDARLEKIPKPYDIIILGMGLDGHTASLFPCAENITQALDVNYSHACIALHPRSAPFARMSLSLNELKKSRQSILLLQGKEKWAVYQKALADLTDWPTMPIRELLKNNLCINTYWCEK